MSAGEHVYLFVDPESTDGVYVFASVEERDRFADAWGIEDALSAAFVTDEPVIGSADALIAALAEAEQ